MLLPHMVPPVVVGFQVGRNKIAGRDAFRRSHRHVVSLIVLVAARLFVWRIIGLLRLASRFGRPGRACGFIAPHFCNFIVL